MNFRIKHQPATVNDLVFRDPHVAQIIADYAAGIRTKHLLLEGPTSTGKSEAARMILKERLSATFGDKYTSIYHGQRFNTSSLKQIEGDWNIQFWSGWAYSVIDEVDFVTAEGRRDIRSFIDGIGRGTLICTTNHLHKLEAEFRSRFYVVKVEQPLANDWHHRALAILKSEGHAATLSMIQQLFTNFQGHARDFMDYVEDVNIQLSKAKENSSAQNTQTTAASQSSTSIVSGIKVPRGLTAKVAIQTTNSAAKKHP